ncbi:MAG: ligB [Geminicoccaceae bacterium]|nr:ligB [Geminicoccaceae bacterium]
MTMRLSEIVETSRRVGEASGRLAKIGHLADLLARCGPEEGRIGIGYATLREARAEPAAAEPSITLGELDRALDKLKSVKGQGAAGERLRLLRELFGRATEAEQDFLLRLSVGELRQGALEGVMVEAIAKAAGLPAGEVRRAVMLAGDAGVVAAAALQQGAAGLRRFGLQLMQPVQPMLAQPAEDIADALAQLGQAAFEWKLDGARIQAHKAGPEVRVFTRRLNDVTAAVPEVVGAVKGLPLDSAILDGEAIALRPDGSPQPFQITMRRFGRKLEVARLQAELPLHCLFFDALALDGDELIDRPNRERAAALAGVLPPELLVPRLVTGQEAEAQAFVKGALAKGHEGAVAKALEAPYAAGRRGAGWLKVKQAHTLDLVVLAAEWGNGRRQGWLSNLHLGARDPEAGGFVMLGKTFKGLTDELLAWQTEQFLTRAIARDRQTVHVRPELVVEIAFNDIQASPHYPGGLALRFARVKAYRPDKRAEEADTIATVRAIHARQAGAGPPESAGDS